MIFDKKCDLPCKWQNAVSIGLGLDIRTVGDMGELPDTLPVFLWPEVPLNLDTLLIILPYSAALAVVGCAFWSR